MTGNKMAEIKPEIGPPIVSAYFDCDVPTLYNETQSASSYTNKIHVSTNRFMEEVVH